MKTCFKCGAEDSGSPMRVNADGDKLMVCSKCAALWWERVPAPPPDADASSLRALLVPAQLRDFCGWADERRDWPDLCDRLGKAADILEKAPVQPNSDVESFHARLGARVLDLMRGEEWTIVDLYNLAHRMREEQPPDWIFICRLVETIAGVLYMKEKNE